MPPRDQISTETTQVLVSLHPTSLLRSWCFRFFFSSLLSVVPAASPGTAKSMNTHVSIHDHIIVIVIIIMIVLLWNDLSELCEINDVIWE